MSRVRGLVVCILLAAPGAVASCTSSTPDATDAGAADGNAGEASAGDATVASEGGQSDGARLEAGSAEASAEGGEVDAGSACVIPVTGAKGTGTLYGDAPYASLSPIQSVYGLVNYPGYPYGLFSVALVYTDYADSCGYSLVNSQKAGGTGVTFYIQSTIPDPGVDASAIFVPGTYSITNGVSDGGNYQLLIEAMPSLPNGPCVGDAGVDLQYSSNGSFTFASVSPTLSGSFDITVQDPLSGANVRHVTGTFQDVANCWGGGMPGQCCGSATLTDAGPGSYDAGSFDAAPPPDADEGDANLPVGVCPPNALAALPAGYSVDTSFPMVWDGSDVIFHAVPDYRQANPGGDLNGVIVDVATTLSVSTGAVSASPARTLYQLQDLLGGITAFQGVIYYAVSFGPTAGVYSIPSTGGNPTVLYGQGPDEGGNFGSMAADAVNVYVLASQFTGNEIVQIPHGGGGSPLVLYTGGTYVVLSQLTMTAEGLVWVETEPYAPTVPAPVIRSALPPDDGGTVGASPFATLPFGSDVTLITPDFVGGLYDPSVPSDQILFASATTTAADGGVSGLSGVFVVSPGATPMRLGAGSTATEWWVFNPAGASPLGAFYAWQAPGATISSWNEIDGGNAVVLQGEPGVDAIATVGGFAKAGFIYAYEQCLYVGSPF
jgi:hypothetical protein